MQDIEAVFITHEHLGHAQGLGRLPKCEHIQYFANPTTATAIHDTFERTFRWSCCKSGEIFCKDFEINTFFDSV